MEIFPQITRKQLGDCKAGELVRLKRGEDQPYGLIATGDEGQFLVFLSAIGDARPPQIALLERPDFLAICYGNSYRIEVDQGGDHVDLTGHRLREKNGALLIARKWTADHMLTALDTH